MKSKEFASNEVLFSVFLNIEKYSSNDREIAFMLGHLVKSKDYELSDDTKDYILKAINEGKLREYFFHRKEPEEFNFWMILQYLFPIVGAIAIATGILKLIDGDFRTGLSIRYGVEIMREGGYFLIFGLIFFLGGLIRIRHERKRMRFLKSLITF
ncbi:hypothetical protein [Lacibacter sp. H407]|uniref:hypothetical protein n=1 Tax=Lacibacter sp. H407 TaxID=3133423 RepID=UPI0030C21B05